MYILLACSLAVSPPSFAQSVSRIVDSVDESRRVVLPGNTRSEVRPEFERGLVDDSAHSSGIQMQALDSLFQALAPLSNADIPLGADRAPRNIGTPKTMPRDGKILFFMRNVAT